MKVLPKIVTACDSKAELKIHSLLGNLELPKKSFALHSLELPQHEYKKWAEIDFLMAMREGWFVLEVKGGRITYKEGLWYYTDKFGEKHANSEGPVKQAKSAYFALREKIRNYGLSKIADAVNSGFGIVFPDLSREQAGKLLQWSECPGDIVAFKEECSSPENFKAFLGMLSRYWKKEATRAPLQADDSDLTDLLGRLRPSFDLVPLLSNRMEEWEKKFTEMTSEQYATMDMATNNRAITVEGGAGTGKTFVALQIARQAVSDEKSVLFVTRNAALINFLKNQPDSGGVDFATLEGLRNREQGKYDLLLIDEGQDMLSLEAIGCFDAVLNGGIEKGSWRWFGDVNMQISPSNPPEDGVLDYLKDNSTHLSLGRNCRNTPEIISFARNVSGAEMGEPLPKGKGQPVGFASGSEPGKLETEITAAIKKWTSQGIGEEDIAVLHASGEGKTMILRALKSLSLQFHELERHDVPLDRIKGIAVSGVDYFKGLERKAVLLSGIDHLQDNPEMLGKIIYRGISRANFLVCIVCSNATAVSLTKLLHKNLTDPVT